jgi:hypothetical protein
MQLGKLSHSNNYYWTKNLRVGAIITEKGRVTSVLLSACYDVLLIDMECAIGRYNFYKITEIHLRRRLGQYVEKEAWICLFSSHISISLIKYTISAFNAFSFALFISLIDLWYDFGTASTI